MKVLMATTSWVVGSFSSEIRICAGPRKAQACAVRHALAFDDRQPRLGPTRQRGQRLRRQRDAPNSPIRGSLRVESSWTRLLQSPTRLT